MGSDANASGGRDSSVARHVPHLFVAPPWEGEWIRVDDAAGQHLEKVLRVAGPVPVTYTDGAGRIGDGVFDDGSIRRGQERNVPKPSSTLTVAVAPPKTASRVRFIVEKLAELGASRLLWIQTEHTEGRPPRQAKAEAWSRAALEQSRGAHLMGVEGPVSLAHLDSYGDVLFADIDGADVDDVGPVDRPVLCIGPEGGFAEHEIPADVTRVKLAPQLLRVETAAIAGAVLLLQRSSRLPPATTVGD